MPSFLAINPERMACPSLQLDLDIDAGGEVELHQRVDRLRRRVDDVENPLMRTDLELLATLLVDMRRTQNRIALDAGRQRNRTAHLGARALRRIHDLQRRLIKDPMVERLQPDANILTFNGHLSVPFRRATPNADRK